MTRYRSYAVIAFLSSPADWAACPSWRKIRGSSASELVGRHSHELLEHPRGVLVLLLDAEIGLVELLVELVGLEAADLPVPELLTELALRARCEDVAARDLGELGLGDRSLLLVDPGLR